MKNNLCKKSLWLLCTSISLHAKAAAHDWVNAGIPNFTSNVIALLLAIRAGVSGLLAGVYFINANRTEVRKLLREYGI